MVLYVLPKFGVVQLTHPWEPLFGWEPILEPNFKFISSSLPARAAVSRQQYIRGWIQGWTCKIDSDISPIPPLIFTWGEKSAKIY